MTALAHFKLTILFLFSTFSLGYSAENKLYFLGGGGEPSGPTTIFDHQIESVAKFVDSKYNKWSMNYSFNGGHTRTEKLLSTKFKKGTNYGPFTEENLEKALSPLEEDLFNQKFEPGSQVMIVINSHGSAKMVSDKSHQIALKGGAATDLKTLKGAQAVSLDILEEVIQRATEAGVKLAILDFSCFSGNTQKLANPNVCIISSTGENQYSYNEIRDPGDTDPFTTFSSRFLTQMRPGKNLEEVFLSARLGSIAPDFPMISTESGKMVDDLLYKIMSPYLVYNVKAHDDFYKSYDLKNLSLAVCKTEDHYSSLINQIDKIEALAAIPRKMFNFEPLKKSLADYRDYQIKFEKALLDVNDVGTEVKSIIARDYPDQISMFDREDGLSILDLNFDSAKKVYKQSLDDAETAFSKDFYKDLYDKLLLKEKITKELHAKLSADARLKLKKFKQVYLESEKTFVLAEKVANEAKKIYDKLYRANMKKEDNPCKDFVL